MSWNFWHINCAVCWFSYPLDQNKTRRNTRQILEQLQRIDQQFGRLRLDFELNELFNDQWKVSDGSAFSLCKHSSMNFLLPAAFTIHSYRPRSSSRNSFHPRPHQPHKWLIQWWTHLTNLQTVTTSCRSRLHWTISHSLQRHHSQSQKCKHTSSVHRHWEFRTASLGRQFTRHRLSQTSIAESPMMVLSRLALLEPQIMTSCP